MLIVWWKNNRSVRHRVGNRNVSPAKLCRVFVVKICGSFSFCVTFVAHDVVSRRKSLLHSFGKRAVKLLCC